MVIGGYSYSKGSLADVELLSLDPITNPVPECQDQPSPLGVPIRAAGGAIDYSSKSMLDNGKEFYVETIFCTFRRRRSVHLWR